MNNLIRKINFKSIASGAEKVENFAKRSTDTINKIKNAIVACVILYEEGKELYNYTKPIIASLMNRNTTNRKSITQQ